MRMPMASLTVAVAFATSPALAETPAELTDRLLSAGKLAEADSALSGILKARPDDAEAQCGLGAIRFFRAAEHLAQSLHRRGLRDGVLLQNFQLPIPQNARPESIRYEDLREIVRAFAEDLGKAESTLAAIGDRDVKLPLHVGRIRLDLDGDGQAGEDERLARLWFAFNGQSPSPIPAERTDAFVIAFDRGDVAWLRGYSHFLMAFAEAYLAYDGQEVFDHSAQLYFRKPVTRYPFLLPGSAEQPPNFMLEIVDFIAMIHVIRMPVREPERLKAALGHLEAMIAMSRESWRWILAETDDDHEWVPNRRQHTVMPGGQVNDDMVKTWMTFLDECEAILQGKKLVPFWRGKDGQGVNLRRVFTEPRPFELVLWIQGTAAAPYLENGPLSDPETWRRLQRVFQGQFFGFAFWFN